MRKPLYSQRLKRRGQQSKHRIKRLRLRHRATTYQTMMPPVGSGSDQEDNDEDETDPTLMYVEDTEADEIMVPPVGSDQEDNDEEETDPTLMLPVYPDVEDDDLKDSADTSRLDLMPTTRVVKTRAFLKPKEDTLINQGLGRHLQTVIGGSHTDVTAATVVRTTVLFLARVHNRALDQNVSMDPALNILTFFVQMICDPAMFSSLTSLLVAYPQSPSTLASHLYAMLKSIKWLSFQEYSISLPNFQHGMHRVTDVISDCVNGTKRALNRSLRKKNMTVSKAVFDGVLPPGKNLVQYLILSFFSIPPLNTAAAYIFCRWFR